MIFPIILLVLAILVVFGVLGYIRYFGEDESSVESSEPVSDIDKTTEDVEGEEKEVKEDENSEEEVEADTGFSVPEDLKDIKGIGPAREEKLLEEFGNERGVVLSKDSDLAEFIPRSVIERMRNKLKNR